MNVTPKFLFDENTGAPFVNALRTVAGLNRRATCEIEHSVKVFGAGAKDRDWIPQLRQSSWVLISEDRGVNSGIGDKLPILCEQYNVPLVLILPSLLHNGGQFEKMRALLAVWPELVATVAGRPCGTWRLKYANSTRTAFKLEEKREKAPPLQASTAVM